MKYIVMAALLMTGTGVFAQSTNSDTAKPINSQPIAGQLHKPAPEQRAKKLTEELGLNAQQEAKVKELYEGVAAAKPGTKEDVKARRAQFEAKMKEILTPDQYTKWQSSRQHPLARGLKAGAAQDVKTKPATLAPGN